MIDHSRNLNLNIHQLFKCASWGFGVLGFWGFDVILSELL